MADFEFKVDRIKSWYSRDHLIDALKKFVEERGERSIGMNDYDDWKGRVACAATIAARFEHSWGKALQAAGARTMRGYKVDPKHMVEAFKKCWAQKKSVPKKADLDAFLARGNYPFRYITYLSFFGGIGRLARLIQEVEAGSEPERALYQRFEQPKASRAIPAKLRHSVLSRDGFRCVHCGKSPKEDKAVVLHVDHRIPHSKGPCNIHGESADALHDVQSREIKSIRHLRRATRQPWPRRRD